ncbi:MAG: phosphoadenylyl-sulfate reductase [Hyphomicrobiales bacterium]
MGVEEATFGGNLSRYEGLPAQDLLAETIVEQRFGKAVLVSSFGTESAVLLHMVSRIDPGFPVFFLDTNKLFGETLDYNRKLADRFGLTAVRRIQPDPQKLAQEDPHGRLWNLDADACCHLRKTEPLDAALNGFEAWITGRKRYQGTTRASLAAVEFVDGRFKVNPLVNWQKHDIEAYFAEHDLPRHPLESRGFASIGCLPCTDRVVAGDDVRAGRWRGRAKTECGIHLSAGSGSSRLPRK